MGTVYVPKEEFEWLKANGGSERLKGLIRYAMSGERPTTIESTYYCPTCKVRLQFANQNPCWHCSFDTRSKMNP